MSEQLQHYEGKGRTAAFRDGKKLNGLLRDLSIILKPVQQSLPFKNPIMPVACIVGNPRSGTTLFQQWLASLDAFSYPTNLLTRFAYAPHIGALIQKLLFDPEFDPHGNFSDIQSDINFESDLGKSQGALACNEFQHFFRNYMPNFDLEWLNDEALNVVDSEGISQGLASIEAAFKKPFTTKANILQFNIPYFSNKIPSLFWVHIMREPVFTMQSLIFARERYYGSRNTWLSAKPKEYSHLKELDVFHQIAGQVYYTNKAICDDLKNLPDARSLTVQYESFCKDPETVYHVLRDKYAAQDCELPSEYKGQKFFLCGNKFRLPKEDVHALESAYSDFVSGSIILD